MRFPSVHLNSEAGIQELGLLLRNHEAPIDELRKSKNAYELFFAGLAAGVRQALADKLAEIRSIEHERRNDVAPELTSFDEQLLDFLISGQLKKERLSAVWEYLERQDGAAEAIDADLVLTASGAHENPVLNALDNFQTLVDARLTRLIPEAEAMIQTRPPTVEHGSSPGTASPEIVGRLLVTSRVLVTAPTSSGFDS
ncbi:MAG TPA: hypothetical protein VNP04_01415 [Alphaproteobacteria bacterium]|nr:hypothetical protein [Alphaproteobacteria bacterium]